MLEFMQAVVLSACSTTFSGNTMPWNDSILVTNEMEVDPSSISM